MTQCFTRVPRADKCPLCSYTPPACAEECDAIRGCSAFNLYYERSPAYVSFLLRRSGHRHADSVFVTTEPRQHPLPEPQFHDGHQVRLLGRAVRCRYGHQPRAVAQSVSRRHGRLECLRATVSNLLSFPLWISSSARLWLRIPFALPPCVSRLGTALKAYVRSLIFFYTNTLTRGTPGSLPRCRAMLVRA